MHQLQCHISSESHPFHKFSTGNWDTLEVQPKAKGLDTRHELLKFYENNYSSNVMHLVVYAKENLDKVQILVENIFQDIPNHNCNRANFPGQPCTSEHLQVLVRAIPIKEGHKLRIIWPITPEIHHHKEGPCRYLGHLIGHEGEGSLYYVLKTLGWATWLSADESSFTMNLSFFEVVIDLTDVGQEHMQDVIGLLFKYISLLKQSGIWQWIFDELSAICETKFHYADKIDPIDYVVNLSSSMQLYPPEDWLVGSSLPSKFNPKLIGTVLDQLSVDNVRIFWESKKFEGKTDKVEKWYGTAYSIEKVSGPLVQDWMQSAPDVKLHLPASNIFIPTDLSPKCACEKVKFPVLLKKSSYSSIWYKPDTMFSTPKAYVKIDFICPHADISPEAEVLTAIFTRLLVDYLNEYAYYAEVAGLYYGINLVESGFQVSLNGYNHKLRILLETIVTKIANFSVKPDRFLVIKETLLKNYQNFKFQQPYQQAFYYCSLILGDRTWPLMDKLAILSNLGAQDLDKFVPTLLSSAYLECFIAGNIERTEAESMIDHIEDKFFKGSNPISRPLHPSQYPPNRIVKLERSIGYFYSAEGLNSNNENSALVHYIQVHRDEFLQNVKLQLFAHVAQQAAFHQLRSVEQLGYITALAQRNDCGIRGVQFIIQSTVKGPRDIDLRVEAFLEMFEKKLVEMTVDEFQSNVNALVDAKLEKFKNLREEARFYWGEISEGTLKFDRRESEVAILKTLTHQDLINFFNEHIKVGAPRKKSLSVRVYGNLHSKEYSGDLNQPVQPNTVKIDDIFSFRRSQPLYGSFKYGNVKL
ncbi:insulin-degrading enzyme-like 1, peroxisomal isoform X2 [Cucumis sativus]|nr:insulin-degrading enzyme-like 1, peroxisomal isoform X2 [Cucumis sativus]